MRKLKDDQQEQLKSHLKQKHIEYVELYDEIYDHYATAYELGDEDLDKVISRLDQTFTQEYIDDHRKYIHKRIYKSIRSIYKREMIAFFKWPQMVTSILSAVLIMTGTYFIALNNIEFYILIPLIAIPMIPFTYFFIQEHLKLVPRNLKSAAYEAINRIGIIPVLAFNACNFIALHSDNLNREANAVILGLSIITLIVYDIITIKVFKQKVKYQMA